MKIDTLIKMTNEEYEAGYRAGIEAAAKWLTDTDFFEEGDAECLRANLLPAAPVAPKAPERGAAYTVGGADGITRTFVSEPPREPGRCPSCQRTDSIRIDGRGTWICAACGTNSEEGRCECGHAHVAGSDGEDGGCRVCRCAEYPAPCAHEWIRWGAEEACRKCDARRTP